VFWQFEVEGAVDAQKTLRQVVNATVNQYLENSNNIQKVVRKVRPPGVNVMITISGNLYQFLSKNGLFFRKYML
jgi:hypothetical protein